MMGRNDTKPAVGNRANIVVGGIVLAVVVVALVIFASMQAAGSGTADASHLRAIVHDGEGGTRELPLSENAELKVTTALGTNIVVVQDGFVFVREADCDNHDCIRQGKLNAPGRQIICLPHKLWVEVVPEGQPAGTMDADAAGEGGYDAVAR